MKIDKPAGVARTYQQNAFKRTEKTHASSRAAKGDGLTLSREAQEVLALRETIGQASEIRSERVEELRRQIEAGTYRPEGREVADKLLKSKILDGLI